MAYITPEKLKAFADKFPDDDTLLQGYCDSAESIVAKYLGYSPESKEYETQARGFGAKFFELESMPVTELLSVTKDGEEVALSLFRVIKNTNYLAYDDDSVFEDGKKYCVIYRAGFEEVPALIETTALQIASLLWESAGGNLAVTSTSFGDMGGRTFQSFKPDRFLEQIKDYKMSKVDY